MIFKNYTLVQTVNCFQTEPGVVYEGRAVQSQKVGIEWTHTIIVEVSDKPLKHKARNKLQFAHHLLVEILLLCTFSWNAIDLLTGLKVWTDVYGF